MRKALLLLTVAAAAAVAAAHALPTSPRLVARIPVGGAVQPCAAAAGGRFVWVSTYAAPYLLKIDPRRNKVVGRTRIGDGSCGLAYGAGSLWVEDTSSNTVSRVSVKTGKRVAAVKVGFSPYDVTFAYGAAWVTTFDGGKLERIDPARNRVVKRLALPGATGVVGAFGSVWSAGSFDVIRIDPKTNAVVARIPVTRGGWTAASADAVWVTTTAGVARIDPETNAVVATILIDGPLGDPDVVAGRPLGAAGAAQPDRDRRSRLEYGDGLRQGGHRPVRRHRDRGRGVGPELERPRRPTLQAVNG